MVINVFYFFILLVILYLLFYYYFNTCSCNNNDYYNTEDFDNNNDYKYDYYDLKYDKPIGYDIEKIVCSKNCCSTQWPTSKSTQIKDPNIDMRDYLPTNLNCNDGIHDTGCICKKKTI
jgi:hypothetical protein